MAIHFRNGRSPWLGLAVALALLPSLVLAADRRSKLPKPGQFNPEHQTVEMFEAIKAGKIGVKLIAKDSTDCRVMIENKTKKPLNVKLPAAFAGVPVLAQAAGLGGLGAGGLGGGRANRGLGGNSNQGFGGGMMGGMGGMGGMMGGMGGMGMGMFNVPPEKVGANAPAMFNVAPEKVGQIRTAAVCLEHGKREPQPSMKYEIKPIEQFTDKKEVHELCRMLGSGLINQRAAQVAAWHLNNNMSWQELAAKRLNFANGTSRPYFAPQELRAGMQLVAISANLAKQREKLQKSSSQGVSLSSN